VQDKHKINGYKTSKHKLGPVSVECELRLVSASVECGLRSVSVSVDQDQCANVSRDQQV